MTIPSSPPERHRVVAARFAELSRGVTDWDARSPVPEWAARDVVAHLVEWSAGFLASSSDVRIEPSASVTEDPVAAWEQHAEAVQRVLDDPATSASTLSNPHLGELPVGEAVDRFYTVDVFMHSWDLARASGQDDTLDADLAGELLEGMRPLDEMLRASGQYGPAMPVADDAPAGDRLMAFVGRDPDWRPAP